MGEGSVLFMSSLSRMHSCTTHEKTLKCRLARQNSHFSTTTPFEGLGYSRFNCILTYTRHTNATCSSSGHWLAKITQVTIFHLLCNILPATAFLYFVCASNGLVKLDLTHYTCPHQRGHSKSLLCSTIQTISQYQNPTSLLCLICG